MTAPESRVVERVSSRKGNFLGSPHVGKPCAKVTQKLSQAETSAPGQSCERFVGMDPRHEQLFQMTPTKSGICNADQPPQVPLASRGVAQQASFHVALPDKAMCTTLWRAAASVSSRACAASKPNAVRSLTSGGLQPVVGPLGGRLAQRPGRAPAGPRRPSAPEGHGLRHVKVALPKSGRSKAGDSVPSMRMSTGLSEYRIQWVESKTEQDAERSCK